MTLYDRRVFLKTSTAAAALLLVPGAVRRHGSRAASGEVPIGVDDPVVRELAMRALEAARDAGATYADVRLTDSLSRRFDGPSLPPEQEEALGVGVRALVDGYWGFASSALWAPDEAARLGRAAVALAKANALGPARVVELGTIPAVPAGQWATPIEEDPFTVPLGEVVDLLNGWLIYAGTQLTSNKWLATASCAFWRQDKIFASTEGSYITQRLARTRAGLEISFNEEPRHFRANAELPWASRGWEYVRSMQHRELVERLIADIEERRALPERSVEVGRYDVVVDALSVASLLDETLGAATELDRALGYEANADGTSYLLDPLAMLGHEPVGAPLLTVTANRSMPGGAATVQWDDEGVMPDAFTLVRAGMLNDFQTTRESAAWLSPWYRKTSRPVRSHGCASAATAADPPLQFTPNLAVTPGRAEVGFGDLVAGLDAGLAITGATLSMDFQHRAGLGRATESGAIYEIKRGKKVALVTGAGFLFRAPELWKGLLRLGGAQSVHAIAATRSKGEPEQEMIHTVTAPPAVFKQMTLVDLLRKA
jgi:TldD protein